MLPLITVGDAAANGVAAGDGAGALVAAGRGEALAIGVEVTPVGVLALSEEPLHAAAESRITAATAVNIALRKNADRFIRPRC